MSATTFTFQPRWKEELVCSCTLGTFILEMPMGVVSVYFPPKSTWEKKSPVWARDHWETVYSQLKAWCTANRIPLYVDASATVFEQ